MGVKNSELQLLIDTTLPDLPNQEFEVGWDNQDFEFTRIYNNESMKIDGGTQIERKIMFDETGNARYRRLFDTDEPSVGNQMSTITVPWTSIGTNYSWDKQEILRNKGNAKGFIDLLQSRRVDGLNSLANLIESRAWKTPNKAADDLNPFGVPYYITQLTKTQTDAGTVSGFAGTTIVFQDGTTATVAAGVDAATEAKWRNYAAAYTKIDNAMLKQARIAAMLTNFKPPIIINDPANTRTAQKRWYTSSNVAADLMDLADQKDDNHKGKEAMGMLTVDAALVFLNRAPVIFVPQLENADNDPLYFVDFAKFIPVTHEGYWMEEGEAMTDRGQHTTFTVFLDGSHNNLCLNRRTCGFVLHKAHTS
ncbi:hypothetical protein LCGC14_0415550 [marine sediment metagenome]|uniref:Bacteriophage Mu GpT domain-containing protein n=1 Tax=marine sediment metagenome TaxID=412755 RepID=A0A0F9SYC5_9ZZZZ